MLIDANVIINIRNDNNKYALILPFITSKTRNHPVVKK